MCCMCVLLYSSRLLPCVSDNKIKNLPKISKKMTPGQHEKMTESYRHAKDTEEDSSQERLSAKIDGAQQRDLFKNRATMMFAYREKIDEEGESSLPTSVKAVLSRWINPVLLANGGRVYMDVGKKGGKPKSLPFDSRLIQLGQLIDSIRWSATVGDVMKQQTGGPENWDEELLIRHRVERALSHNWRTHGTQVLKDSEISPSHGDPEVWSPICNTQYRLMRDSQKRQKEVSNKKAKRKLEEANAKASSKTGIAKKKLKQQQKKNQLSKQHTGGMIALQGQRKYDRTRDQGRALMPTIAEQEQGSKQSKQEKQRQKVSHREMDGDDDGDDSDSSSSSNGTDNDSSESEGKLT